MNLFKLKRWLRTWMEVEARSDMSVGKRLTDVRIQSLEVRMGALEISVSRFTAILSELKKDVTKLNIIMAQHEIEQFNIEAGDMPCGCFSIPEHEAAKHVPATIQRVERWMKWKSRERTLLLGGCNDEPAKDVPGPGGRDQQRIPGSVQGRGA